MYKFKGNARKRLKEYRAVVCRLKCALPALNTQSYQRSLRIDGTTADHLLLTGSVYQVGKIGLKKCINVALYIRVIRFLYIFVYTKT